MLDPADLYTVDEAVAAKLENAHPVLIHQLDGFVDAGQAGRIFSAHLLENLEHEVLAEFDHDQLHDYRSRRPAMIFDTNRWTSYADLHLRIHRVVDEHGEVFLLLSGPEPDVQWERLAAALIGLIERLGVRLTVSVHGIPMAVPHTRPITLTAHSNNKELIADHTPWVGEVQVPGSVSNLLEYRMAQHGHDVVGFTVHVPHYLAQTDYPLAAAALLTEVAKSGSLKLPLTELTEAAAEVQAKVDEQVGASTEVAQVVEALERQYDAFIAAQENQSLLARDEDLPSGDELGAEFERFLAARDKRKEGFKDGDDGD
jgi:hypothetical protein